MRKTLTALLFVGACTSSTTVVPVTTAATSAAGGSAAARPALDAFLHAIQEQDLQAMSLAWGDKNGPIRDSKLLSREEVEKREVILTRCLKHDRFRVLGETAAPDNERVFQVELMRGTLTRVTDFYTARGADRWYVRTANLDNVKDLCSAK